MTTLNEVLNAAAPTSVANALTRDYSLLRPFDLEAAKRGEPVLQQGGDAFEVRWVARSGDGKSNIVEGPGMHAGILKNVEYAPDEWLRMAPLCWVEGRPVYKGDVLYWNNCGVMKPHVADRFENVGDGRVWQDHGSDYDKGFVTLRKLTWTPPKVKREGWINVCRINDRGSNQHGLMKDRIIRNCDIFDDEQKAKDWAAHCGDVLDTVRIEWEEQAGGAQ